MNLRYKTFNFIKLILVILVTVNLADGLTAYQLNNPNVPVIFSNDMFKIQFDLLTPRNHLIILFKNKTRVGIKDLHDIEIRSLIHLVDSFMNKFIGKHEEFTLAFHTNKKVNSIYFILRISSIV